MGKIVKKAVVKRKPGHLYYVDGQGNVCEAKMARGGKKKKKAAKKKVVKKKVAKKKPAKKKVVKKKKRR
jgi:adenylate kinase